MARVQWLFFLTPTVQGVVHFAASSVMIVFTAQAEPPPLDPGAIKIQIGEYR